MKENELKLSVQIKSSLSETRARLTALLAEKGFGLVTELDAQAKFKEKLGKESSGYQILGFCNPALAYEVLQVESDAGLFLPCTVVLREISEVETEVFTADPALLLSRFGFEGMDEFSAKVRAVFTAVFQSLSI